MEVKNEMSERELIDEGTYNAICIGIVDMGTQVSSYAGKEKSSRKISLTFEVQDETDSEGKPFLLYKSYNLALSPKATFAKDLKSWKGIEVPKGKSFNVDTLLSQPALITIAHQEAKDGSATYANITTISAPLKGTKFRKPRTELISFYMDGNKLDVETYDKLSQYIQGKIAESPEFKALAKAHHAAPTAKNGKKK